MALILPLQCYLYDYYDAESSKGGWDVDVQKRDVKFR